MSRYRGPRVKKMRALGLDLPGMSRKSIERRPQPPGQHGANRRGKLSDYARQLREKQKLRLNYGLSERQFTRRFNAEIGCSPAAYVERARLERARSLLEEADQGLEAIKANPHLQDGLNTHKGKVTNMHVAESLNLDFVAPLDALGW